MIVAATLALYAAIAGAFAPRLLRSADWGPRAPRLAIAAWQAAGFSVALAMTLAAVSLAVPVGALSGGMSELLRSCSIAIRNAYTTAGGAAGVGVGVVLAVGVTLRVAGCTASAMSRARLERRHHQEWLEVLGRCDEQLGATVVDSTTAAAYCLPGRVHRVVVSTAALAALSPAELSAVLAHERAHLRGRHHLVVAGAEGLRRAFPRVPLFAVARMEVSALIEMLADDRASRSQPRRIVASALLALASMNTPTASLGAGGAHTAARVRRLIAPADPLRRLAEVAVITAITFLLAAPVLVAATPALAVAGMRHCQMSPI